MLALSCLGAAAVQQALTPKVADWMEPKVTSYVAGVIRDGVETSTESAMEQTGEVGLTVGGQQVTLGDLAGILSGKKHQPEYCDLHSGTFDFSGCISGDLYAAACSQLDSESGGPIAGGAYAEPRGWCSDRRRQLCAGLDGFDGTAGE